MLRRPSSAISRSIGRMSAVGRDVIEERQARPRRDARQDRADHVLGRGQREGDRRDDDPRARPLGDELERIPARLVRVVGGEQLVVRGERERPEDGVDAARRIGDEGEVLGCRPHEGGQRGPRGVEPVVELAGEEADGLGLHLGPQGRLMPQDFRGAGPEGSVVQEGQAALERPERGVRRGRAHGRRRAVKPRCPRPGRGPGGGGASGGCRPAPA